MNNKRWWTLPIPFLVLSGMLWTLWLSPGEGASHADPMRFEKEIQAYEAEDVRQPPPRQAVLCVGSSTMRMWQADIHQDLAPLTVLARGFGGSTMHDLLYYVDRLVTVYRPRAIVVYEGENDVTHGIQPERIRETFRAFVRRVHRDLPQTRIYFLAIKPSADRWKLWATMRQTNQLIAEDCAQDARLTYVDTASSLLDANGQVQDELYGTDQLHLNRAGYEMLRDTLKPILISSELPAESPQESRVGQRP